MIEKQEQNNRKIVIKRKEVANEKVEADRQDFAAKVKICKEHLAKYDKTRKPKHFEVAKDVYYNDLIGGSYAYKDIKTNEMRLKYLTLLFEEKLFPVEREKFKR